MKRLDISKFSNCYEVKNLKATDVENIYDLCKANTQYYQYCGKEPSMELIQQDMVITPPNIPLSKKYYVGFFDQDELVAIMDFIDGYPSEEYGFIGFFMMNIAYQRKGIGSRIVTDICNYCQKLGIAKIRLGIDKENPQSNYFWRRNAFEIIREVQQEDGIILVAERIL